MGDSRDRLLLVYKALCERTDKDNPITEKKIEKILNDFGITADRKTIYQDFDAIGRQFCEGPMYKLPYLEGKGYYFDNRLFSLSELKIFVDAVQSSRFVTNEQSRELIGKLKKLTSIPNGHLLQRDLYSSDKVSISQDAISNVDALYLAMNENTKVRFKYCQWNINKELEERHGGKYYEVSPWKLVWSDDNYYLLAYEESSRMFKNFRVEKIKDIIRLSDEPRSGADDFRKFDFDKFSKSTFGMYGGERKKIKMECPISAMNPIIDRFGTDIITQKIGEDRFAFVTEVVVSPQFFGWVVGLGGGVRIVFPQDVVENFETHLKEMLKK